MSILSITLPSNTFITNGKHITFKAPCDIVGGTKLLINGDEQPYQLVDSNNQNLSEYVTVFGAGAMVHVILDVYRHFAYVQNSIVASGGQGISGVESFNKRTGNVTPQATDYTPEFIGAAAASHAEQHKRGGKDAISPADIGAAPAVHEHDYSPVGHAHIEYALKEHEHEVEDLKGVAKAYHKHSAADIEGAFTKTEADSLYFQISDSDVVYKIGALTQDEADLLYAGVNHTHDIDAASLGLAPLNHTHTADSIGASAIGHSHSLSELKAASDSHTHTADEIGAAGKNHTHKLEDLGAAEKNHTHSPEDIGALTQGEADLLYSPIGALTQADLDGLNEVYFPISGGEFTGNVLMGTHSIFNIGELSFSDINISEGHYTDENANAVPIVMFTSPIGNVVARGISAPINDNDIANKEYVDAAIAAAIANIGVYDGTVNYENV
jgi:hypothetical protein